MCYRSCVPAHICMAAECGRRCVRPSRTPLGVLPSVVSSCPTSCRLPCPALPLPPAPTWHAPSTEQAQGVWRTCGLLYGPTLLTHSFTTSLFTYCTRAQGAAHTSVLLGVMAAINILHRESDQ